MSLCLCAFLVHIQIFEAFFTDGFSCRVPTSKPLVLPPPNVRSYACDQAAAPRALRVVQHAHFAVRTAAAAAAVYACVHIGAVLSANALAVAARQISN